MPTVPKQPTGNERPLDERVNPASAAAIGAVERILRSPWRLSIAVAMFVAVLSWLGSDQQRQALEIRLPEGWGEVNTVSLFVPEFVHNALWALLAPLLLALFVWSWRRLHPLLFAGAQIALCLGCAWGMGWIEHHSTDRLRDWVGPPVRESADAPSLMELERLSRERRRERDPQRRNERAEREDEGRESAPDGEGPAQLGDPQETGGERADEGRVEPGRDGPPREGPGRDGFGPRPNPGPPPGLGQGGAGGGEPGADVRSPRSAFQSRMDRLRARGLAPTARETAGQRLPREVLLYLIALGLSGAAFAFLARRESERRQLALELEAAQLSSELSRTQLRTLRAQLQPHFLFNALHGIGGLVRTGRADEALRTLSGLGGLLRRTLDSDRADRWPLRQELELIDEYLAVEGVRLGDRLTIEREFDPAALDVEIPPLLLLPIVENAIRHGIAAKTGPGTLRITAHRESDRLRLVVEDDGTGFADEVLALRRHPSDDEVHVGLFNTRERLVRIFGADGQRFELSNGNQLGARGACVTIELPCEPKP
ncbi:Sensor histidine kinase YpdA [Planctomycetes bacterium Pla163]|uniref:Sensor histidine kinase YpdA n=1 Tax=Rohdeia mirabilis TaxID=2528008 RepID=A0A518D3S9_9BACT|nr:Sensor histidine kinase YpdA [Planctomycetes bacterium Pla163]